MAYISLADKLAAQEGYIKTKTTAPPVNKTTAAMAALVSNQQRQKQLDRSFAAAEKYNSAPKLQFVSQALAQRAPAMADTQVNMQNVAGTTGAAKTVQLPSNAKPLPTTQLGKAVQAWQYGQGQNMVNEGMQEKIKTNNPAAGAEKIAEGTRLMQENSAVVFDAPEYKGLAEAATDPDFYSESLTSQLPSSASIMAGSVAGGLTGAALKGIGAGIGAGSLGTLTPVAAALIVAGTGVNVATAGWAAKKEANMEQADTYQQVFVEQQAKGKSVSEAHKIAMGAAKKTYAANLALLGASNLAEQMTIFGKPVEFINKAGKMNKIVSAAKNLEQTSKLGKATVKTANIIGKTTATGLQEGGEEGIQYGIQQWSQDKPIDMTSPEARESMAMGLIQGSAMALAGATGGALIEEDVNERKRKAELKTKPPYNVDFMGQDGSYTPPSGLSGYSKDIIENPSPAQHAGDVNPILAENFHQKILAGLPQEEVTVFKSNIQSALDDGVTEEDAVRSAVDQLMGKASTKVVVENAYARTIQEYQDAAMAQAQNPGLEAQSQEPETVDATQVTSEAQPAEGPPDSAPVVVGAPARMTPAGQARTAAGLLGGAKRTAPASNLRVKSAEATETPVDAVNLTQGETGSIQGELNFSQDELVSGENAEASTGTTEPPVNGSGDTVGASITKTSNPAITYKISTSKVNGEQVHSVIGSDGKVVMSYNGAQGHKLATKAKKALALKGKYLQLGNREYYVQDVDFDDQGAPIYEVVDTKKGDSLSGVLSDEDIKQVKVNSKPVTKEGQSHAEAQVATDQGAGRTSTETGQDGRGSTERRENGSGDRGVADTVGRDTQTSENEGASQSGAERTSLKESNAEARRHIAKVAKGRGVEMSYVPPSTHSAAQRALVNLGKALGVEVRFFKSDDQDASEFVLTENRKVVYVREGGGHSGRTELWSLGHGFIHSLKTQHPDLYEELDAFLMSTIRSGQLKEYLEFISEGTSKEYLKRNDAATREEILGDAFGNYVASEKFFQLLHDQNKSLYEKVVSYIKSLFKHLRKTVTGTRVEDTLAAEQISTLEAQFEDMITKVTDRVAGISKDAIAATQEGYAQNKEDSQEDGAVDPEVLIQSIEDAEKTDVSFSVRPGTKTYDGKSGINTYAIGISAHLKNTGYIDLRGQIVKTPRQLAVLAQIYRDPQFETSRYFWMKGNVIVGHEAVTSRVPGMSRTTIENNTDEAIGNMADRMRRMGADGYYLLHNHPSGNPTPSVPDRDYTERIANKLPGCKGHVIINSNKYAFFTPTTATKYKSEIKELKPSKTDKLLKPLIDHPLLGTTITGPQTIADSAKIIQQDMATTNNRVVVFYTSPQLAIRAVQDVPLGTFNDTGKGIDYLRGRMREFGCMRCFLVFYDPAFEVKAKNLVRAGVVLDAIIPAQGIIIRNQLDAKSIDNKGWAGKEVKALKVGEVDAEENPGYNKDGISTQALPLGSSGSTGTQDLAAPVDTGSSFIENVSKSDIQGALFSTRIDTVTSREDGLNVAAGIINASTGRGEKVTIVYPDRDFNIYDEDAARGFLDIVNAVDPEQRTKAFNVGMGSNKLEDQPIIQLSSGCFRAAAVLQAIKAGVAPKDLMEFIISCHGACYKNYDTAATRGSSPWSRLIGQARRDYAANGAQSSAALAYLQKIAKRELGIKITPEDLPKPGKSSDSKVINSLKAAFSGASTEKRTRIYDQVIKDGWHTPWTPQEARTPVIIGPDEVVEKISHIREEDWNVIKNSKSSFIRGNQQGDWLPELATGTWQAYAETMFREMDKRGIDKKISVVTTAWYVPVSDETLREVAEKFGDRIIVQVTGPIDFQDWEADLRLEGFKRLQKAGLNPVMRLITDEFGMGGMKLNDPKAVKKTIKFIVDNKISPKQILETPLHIDAAGFNGTNPEGIPALAERIQGLYDVTYEDAVDLASKVILRNVIFEQGIPTDKQKTDKKGNLVFKGNKPVMEEEKIGHSQVGLTYSRLAELGVSKKDMDALRKLGYSYNFNRLNPATGKNEVQEGVFPAQCCTTGKCLSCAMCAVHSRSLIKVAKDKPLTQGEKNFLSKIDPAQASSFLTEIDTLFSSRKGNDILKESNRKESERDGAGNLQSRQMDSGRAGKISDTTGKYLSDLRAGRKLPEGFWSFLDKKYGTFDSKNPNYPVAGARMIVVDGLKDFSSWAKAMTKEYGKDKDFRIRIDTIWDKSKGLAEIYRRDMAERLYNAGRLGNSYDEAPPTGAFLLAEKEPDTLFSSRKGTKETDVNTPEFKKWFGDSKVVDENGVPKPVYHGSAFGGFTEFDPEKISMSEATSQQGAGFYFTDKVKWAKEYLLKDNGKGRFVKSKDAEMYKVYLSVQNPLDITENKRTLKNNQIRDIIKQGAEWNKGWWKWYYTNEKNISDEEVYGLFLKDMAGKSDKDVVQKLPKWFGYRGGKALLSTFKEVTGHDGIVENFRGQGNIYVALSPTQIKSVDNQGTWDEGNPDIMFSSRKETDTKTPEFKKWFKDSKVVNGRGQPLLVYHGTWNLKDFEAFKTEYPDELGAHFGTKKQAAIFSDAGYGRILPGYLSMQNPLEMPDIFGEIGAVILHFKNDPEFPKSPLLDEAYRLNSQADSIADSFAEIREIKTEASGLVRDYIKSLGYDGIKYVNTVEDPGKTSWIIFEPTQFKSQFNRGTYDETNPDFLLSDRSKEEQTLFSSRKEAAPTFFSQLQRVIEAKMPNRATPEQIRGIVGKGAVKEEELKWVDLDGFLEGKDKVTKQELLDYLKANDLQIEEVTKGAKESVTSYGTYQLPGGENYRELLFTLPDKNENPGDVDLGGNPDKYQSGHWSEKNVLAHVRFNDRIDVDGEKVLFIEEVQSDWHQEGRRKGYRGDNNSLPGGWHVELNDKADGYELINASGRTEIFVTKKYLQTLYEKSDMATATSHFIKAVNAKTGGVKVPDAPLKATWHEFVLKRMLRYAAENGYDRLAWTTGEQQAERYDLSKVISEVIYDTERNILMVYGKQGEHVFSEMCTPEETEQYVGKELAQKIIDFAEQRKAREASYVSEYSEEDGGYILRDSNGELVRDWSGAVEVFESEDEAHDWVVGEVSQVQFEGLDLKVGGSGMKGFYDKMIPSFLNKYAKKWNARVEKTDFEYDGTGDEKWEVVDGNGDVYKTFASEFQLNDWEQMVEDGIAEEPPGEWYSRATGEHSGNFTAPFLPITAAMRESVLQEGQPLFSSRKNRDLGDGTRSESFPTTAGEGGQLDPWSAGAVGAETQPGGRGTYTPITLSDLDQEALVKYEKDPVAAERFLSGEFKESEAPLAVAVSRHLTLDLQDKAQRLELEGDYEAAKQARDALVDTVMKAAERLRTYGQAISAARLYQTLNAASALVRAEKISKKMYDELPNKLQKDIEQASQGAATELQKVNEEAVDQVTGSEDVQTTLETALENKGRRKERAEKKVKEEKAGARKKKRQEKEDLGPDAAEMLANRVRAYLEDKDMTKSDPIREMVNTLFKIAKEKLPEQPGREQRSPLDVVVQALQRREEYFDIWDEAKRIFKEKYADDFEGIEDYLNHYLSQPYPQSLVGRAVQKLIADSKIDVDSAIASNTTGELRGRIIKVLSRDAELSRALGRDLNTSISREVDKVVAERTIKLQQRLAKQVIDIAEGKTKDTTAAADMMRTLMKIAQTRLPRDKKQPRNELELVAEAIKHRKIYRHIWDGAKRQIIAKYGPDHEIVKTLTAFFESDATTPYDASQLESGINRGLKEADIKLSELVRKHYTVVDATGRSLAEKLVADLDLSEADATVLARKIQAQMAKMTQARKEKILDSIIKGKVESKTKEKKDLITKICELSNLGAFNSEQYRRAFCEDLDLPVMTDHIAKLIIDLTNRIQTTTGDARDEACMMLDALLANMKKPSVLRKISTIQNISMLLNLKTIFRNVVGNSMFYVSERFSHLVATPIDWARSEVTGSERTVTFKTGGQHGFWEGFMKGAKAGWNGWTIQGLETQYDIGRGLAFNPEGNPAERLMSVLERSLRVVLQGFDYATYNLVYSQTLGELAVLQLMNNKQEITQENIDKAIKALDAKALEIADNAGKYTTFQDDNVLSKNLVKMKNALNFGKEWGLGDAVLKFPKTPGALMMRGIEYSPAGFVRAIMIGTQPYRSGGKDADPRELALAISRATIGTFGLTALGWTLAALGILMPDDSEDSDVRTLRTAQGIGGNRINVTAFTRWFFSGMDDKKAALREGDILVSYDWAQPLALAVAFGVGVSEAFDSSLSTGERAMSVPSAVATGLASGVATLADQPLLQGVQKLFQPSYGDNGAQHMVKVFGTIAGDIPATFVPTAIYQMRQLIDENQRDTKDPDMLGYAGNKVVNKLPGASKSLPQKYDTLGQPMKTYWKGTNNLFNVLLNPAFVSRYEPTPEAKLVLDLYESSGDTGQFPHSLQRYIKYDGKRYDLTSAEYQGLQRVTGEGVAKRFKNIPESMPDEEKIKVMTKILEEEGSRARKRFLRDKKLK